MSAEDEEMSLPPESDEDGLGIDLGADRLPRSVAFRADEHRDGEHQCPICGENFKTGRGRNAIPARFLLESHVQFCLEGKVPKVPGRRARRGAAQRRPRGGGRGGRGTDDGFVPPPKRRRTSGSDGGGGGGGSSSSSSSSDEEDTSDEDDETPPPRRRRRRAAPAPPVRSSPEPAASPPGTPPATPTAAAGDSVDVSVVGCGPALHGVKDSFTVRREDGLLKLKWMVLDKHGHDRRQAGNLKLILGGKLLSELPPVETMTVNAVLRLEAAAAVQPPAAEQQPPPPPRMDEPAPARAAEPPAPAADPAPPTQDDAPVPRAGGDDVDAVTEVRRKVRERTAAKLLQATGSDACGSVAEKIEEEAFAGMCPGAEISTEYRRFHKGLWKKCAEEGCSLARQIVSGEVLPNDLAKNRDLLK